MSRRPSEHRHVAHAMQGYGNLSDDNKRAIGSYLTSSAAGLMYRQVGRQEARSVRICPPPPDAFQQYILPGTAVFSTTCPPPNAPANTKWYQNSERTCCYRTVENFGRLACEANDIPFILAGPPIGKSVIWARTVRMIDAVVERGSCEPLAAISMFHRILQENNDPTMIDLDLMIIYLMQLYASGQLRETPQFQGVTALLFPLASPRLLYPGRDILRRFWYNLTAFVVSTPEFVPNMRSTSRRSYMIHALGMTPRTTAYNYERDELAQIFVHFGVF